MSTRKIKGDLKVENNLDVDNELGLTLETTERALELDASGKVKSSAVTSTELGHLSGVTSGIQAQINTKANDVDVVKRDGSQDFTADQSMGGFKLTNLAAPTADNDAARKIDVDTAQAGIKVKEPVDVVSTANITLSGEQTIDGVLTSASRVLVAGQTNPVENGIYVSAAGAWSRATDFDGTPNGEVQEGNTVLVQSGTDNTDTLYILNSSNAADPTAINVGTDEISFVVYSRAESVQAGDGLDKTGLTLSVDVTDIVGTGLEDDGSNNLRIASTAAGTGLTGGSGSALSIDFDTTGQRAVAADTLAATATGQGASLIGIEDAAAQFTATDVEGALGELKTDLTGKQNDVITTQGDLVIGDATGEEARLGIGTNGQVLQSNGTTASWQTISQTDELVKISANDTTEKYLEDAIVVSEGVNATNILETSTLNDGLDEDFQIQLDETKIDHDVLANFVANEHIDHSTVSVVAGGEDGLVVVNDDLTSNIGLAVDINGTTEETSADDADTVLIYDDSAGALRKMSRANFVGAPGASPGDISETSFAGANNVSVAADVTGLAFANATVRSFKVHGSIVVDATADLFEEFELHGIQRGADWVITDARTGDDSLVDFTITNAGQVQYTSGNYTGFVALTIKFRAITTSV
jgi:hypothetical protein